MIHALFGPEDPEDEEIKRQQVIYIVIDPSVPTRPMLIRRITVPEGKNDMWSVAAAQDGAHVVVVRCDGKLLWTTAESGEWQLLRGKAENIEKLRLFAADENPARQPRFDDRVDIARGSRPRSVRSVV